MTARTLAPFDPAVVAPWDIGDGPHGAVLIHGFAGTPPELRGLGEVLSGNGYRCIGPALTGHAAAPEDLRTTSWQEWAQSVAAAVETLRATCDSVVVIGQSMGGTLALHAAATDPTIHAVVTLAAPIKIHSPLAPYLGVLKHVVKWHVPKSDSDLYRREGLEELHSYGRRSTHAVHELFRLMRHTADELAQIRQPILMLQGMRDTVVDPVNLDLISKRLVSCTDIETERYPRSGHAISVDVDRDAAFARILTWLESPKRQPVRQAAPGSATKASTSAV